MSFNNALITFCIILLLSACGGGGGGGGGATTTNNTDANGIWSGNTSTTGLGTSNTLALFNDGEFIAINFDFSEFYTGTYSTRENSLSGSGRGYDVNGPFGATGSISGNVTAQGTILATITTSLDTTGTLDLAYSRDLYERPSSFSKIEGRWVGSISGLNFFIDISASGDIYAAASDGCNVNGEVQIPNPQRNVYKIDIDISGSTCSVSGSYDGLGAILDSDSGVDDLLAVGYSNSSYGFAYIAARPIR